MNVACTSRPEIAALSQPSRSHPLRIVHKPFSVTGRMQHYLKDKEPFDLGGASTKCAVNWIFWWETALAVFSIIGAYYVVPNASQPFLEKGWVQAICGPGDALDDPTSGFWGFIFAVSSGCRKCERCHAYSLFLSPMVALMVAMQRKMLGAIGDVHLNLFGIFGVYIRLIGVTIQHVERILP